MPAIGQPRFLGSTAVATMGAAWNAEPRCLAVRGEPGLVARRQAVLVLSTGLWALVDAGGGDPNRRVRYRAIENLHHWYSHRISNNYR